MNKIVRLVSIIVTILAIATAGSISTEVERRHKLIIHTIQELKVEERIIIVFYVSWMADYLLCIPHTSVHSFFSGV